MDENENKEEIIIEETTINETNTEVKKNSGLSIASMVLGIVALVCVCSWLVSTVCGVLAVIFGAIELKKAKQPMAKAGLIMGIIALALEVFYLVLAFGFGFATAFI